MSDEMPADAAGVTHDDLQHLYKLIWDELPLCGCGEPWTGVALVHELLKLAPFYERTHDEIAGLIGTPGAYYLVLGALDAADLIEHGGSVGGSWLTSKGEWCLRVLSAVGIDPLALIDRPGEIGFPHNGDDCTDLCWAAPV